MPLFTLHGLKTVQCCFNTFLQSSLEMMLECSCLTDQKAERFIEADDKHSIS